MRFQDEDSPQRPGSPFDSPVGTTLGWRRLVRTARNIVVVAAFGVAFVDLVGEPLLRWEYRYHERGERSFVFDATYVGVSGRRAVRAGDLGAECPVLLFAKPQPPLWRRATKSLAPWAPAVPR